MKALLCWLVLIALLPVSSFAQLGVSPAPLPRSELQAQDGPGLDETLSWIADKVRQSSIRTVEGNDTYYRSSVLSRGCDFTLLEEHWNTFTYDDDGDKALARQLEPRAFLERLAPDALTTKTLDLANIASVTVGGSSVQLLTIGNAVKYADDSVSVFINGHYAFDLAKDAVRTKYEAVRQGIMKRPGKNFPVLMIPVYQLDRVVDHRETGDAALALRLSKAIEHAVAICKKNRASAAKPEVKEPF